MDCSVVIPCYGGAELTSACLASLLAQTGDHELEILLVDNAQDPATAALAARSPTIRLLPQPHNRGFGGGCNRGVAAARMPFVLILNNDTQAAVDLLTRLHQALEQDPRIAFAAPVSNRVKGLAQLPCGVLGRTAEGRAAIAAELNAQAGAKVQDTDSVAGLCLLARRQTLRHIGPFDERFGAGNYEDDDLCLRARRLGYRIVIARAAFLHHEAHQTFARMGLDLASELRKRRADFVAKWCHDDAGRAVLAAQQGDLAAAASAARRARLTSPNWPDADWHLGRFLVESQRPEAAVWHLQAFLRHSPNHTDAIIQLGICWLRLDQTQNTTALWQWAQRSCYFSPTQVASLLASMGQHAHEQGRFAAAATHFEAAIEIRPDEPALRNMLGAALIEQHRFADAIDALQPAAAAGLALANMNLGICHYQTGDLDAALEQMRRAAIGLPDDAVVARNYAQVCAVAGRAPGQGPGPEPTSASPPTASSSTSGERQARVITPQPPPGR